MRTERQVIEEKATFEAAFDAHYLPLLKLCVLMTADRSEAEDLVQEAFLRVAPRLETLPGEELRPYLRTVAVSLWRSRLRRLAVERRHRRDQSESALVPDSSGSVGLRDAIRRLPRRQRACLVLRYYEDLPVEECARLLGCSTGTVKIQTNRAIERLRREMSE